MKNIYIPTADIMRTWASVPYVELSIVYHQWELFWKDFQEILSDTLMRSTMYNYLNIRGQKYIQLERVATVELIQKNLSSFKHEDEKQSINTLFFVILQKELKEMGYTIKGYNLSDWDLNLYL